MARLIRLPDAAAPTVSGDAWVAPGAALVGDVRLAAGSSVWYGAVLRADGDAVHVAEGTNLQDGVIAHADPGLPVEVGAGVSVGHRAVLHGCRVGDHSLVGMGAVLLNGCHVGSGCLVAAGSVLLEGSVFEPGVLIAGVPARVVRAVRPAEADGIRANADDYVRLSLRHRAATADPS